MGSGVWGKTLEFGGWVYGTVRRRRRGAGTGGPGNGTDVEFHLAGGPRFRAGSALRCLLRIGLLGGPSRSSGGLAVSDGWGTVVSAGGQFAAQAIGHNGNQPATVCRARFFRSNCPAGCGQHSEFSLAAFRSYGRGDTCGTGSGTFSAVGCGKRAADSARTLPAFLRACCATAWRGSASDCAAYAFRRRTDGADCGCCEP